RIPAPVGHVDPAAYREGIVDHDDLLVVAAPDRVDAVELEVDPLVRQPAHQIEHHRSSRHHLERADAPLEDADLEAPAMPRQPRDEAAEPSGKLPLPRLLPPAPAVGQVDAGVEIP